MIYGVDLSFANGNPRWASLGGDDRVRFVYSRACYGDISYDDDGPIFRRNHDACKALGKPFGSYLFWLANHDGDLQARHFLQQANGRYGDRSPVVDVEEGSFAYATTTSLQQRIETLAATLSTIEKGLAEPIIYTDPNTWATYFGNTDAFAGHRFWIAAYSYPPGAPPAVPGIRKVVMHQFSDGRALTPIPGLSRPGNNVDRDVLIGDDLAVIAR